MVNVLYIIILLQFFQQFLYISFLFRCKFFGNLWYSFEAGGKDLYVSAFQFLLKGTKAFKGSVNENAILILKDFFSAEIYQVKFQFFGIKTFFWYPEVAGVIEHEFNRA